MTPKDVPPGAVAVPVGDHVALVDESDAERVLAHHWRPMVSQSGKVYAYTVIDCTTVLLQRFILGTDPGLDTDHKDGDPLNNRRSNLRPATRSQNTANAPKSTRADGRPWSSIYKGVFWNKAQRKWQASIRVNGRLKFLGRFTVEADAARAYDAEARKAFGPFAYTNFPAEPAEVAA